MADGGVATLVSTAFPIRWSATKNFTPPPSASLASVADDRRPGTPIEIEKGKENEKKIKENCRLMQKKLVFFTFQKAKSNTLEESVNY